MVTTSTITGRVPLPDNSVAAGAYVEFVLTGADAANETVLAAPVIAEMDGTSNISVELWPNSFGDQMTRYRTTAYVPGPSGAWLAVPLGYIVVPEDDADIADLIPIRIPANASNRVTFAQGATIRLALRAINDYTGLYQPLSGLTASAAMQRGSDAAVPMAATIAADVVEVVLAAATTAALPAGLYVWAVNLTDGVSVSTWTGEIALTGAPQA